MKIAYYVKKESLAGDARVREVVTGLERGGNLLYDILKAGSLAPDTDVLLSFGGDGTFLTAARVAAPSGIPLVGVNLGRLGFLSAYTPEDVVAALLAGEYDTEERSLLRLEVSGCGEPMNTPFALNEICISRACTSMLGVDVTIDGSRLPTYWADGLLVSTSSGSTAYNLSVGGPICFPDAKVLIIAPIAPHNLNVRPLVVPQNASVSISIRSREKSVLMSVDNLRYTLPAGASVDIRTAPFPLKVLRLRKGSFVKALRDRLLWGQDVRNSDNNSF